MDENRTEESRRIKSKPQRTILYLFGGLAFIVVGIVQLTTNGYDKYNVYIILLGLIFIVASIYSITYLTLQGSNLVKERIVGPSKLSTFDVANVKTVRLFYGNKKDTFLKFYLSDGNKFELHINNYDANDLEMVLSRIKLILYSNNAELAPGVKEILG